MRIDGAELSFDKDSIGSNAKMQRQEEEEGEFELASSITSGRLRLLWQDHRSGILAGSVIIALVVATIVLDSYCLLGNRFHQWTHARMCPSQTSAEDSQRQITELTAILDDISRNPYRKAALEGIPDAENLQDCLKNCGNDHGSQNRLTAVCCSTAAWSACPSTAKPSKPFGSAITGTSPLIDALLAVICIILTHLPHDLHPQWLPLYGFAFTCYNLGTSYGPGISFATDDAKPSHHFAQETPSPTILLA